MKLLEGTPFPVLSFHFMNKADDDQVRLDQTGMSCLKFRAQDFFYFSLSNQVLGILFKLYGTAPYKQLVSDEQLSTLDNNLWISHGLLKSYPHVFTCHVATLLDAI